jgi:hypothetical protein
VAAVVASALAVPAAQARRAPSSAEGFAIATALYTYIHQSGSPVASDTALGQIYVSTADGRYALALLSSASSGPARALLRRVSQSATASAAVTPKKKAKKKKKKKTAHHKKKAKKKKKKPVHHQTPAGGGANGGFWTVVDYGPGNFHCADAPAAVFNDLFQAPGACLPAGY